MHILDQRILGIMILILLGSLVIVKRVTTGSILDQPKGSLIVQLVNIFNLFFLLVVNPLASILLITSRITAIDPTHMTINSAWGLMLFEITGLVMYTAGFSLMAGALITLRNNYQLGGSTPRTEDDLVKEGPYRIVRHPMYTAALSISMGLAFLIQSWGFFCVFILYFMLISMLIPMEEYGLKKVYGDQYNCNRSIIFQKKS